MITAVDTNILLDLLIPGAVHQQDSRDRLVTAMEQGPLILGDAVYTELAASFPARGPLDRFLDDAAIQLQPCDRGALFAAGSAWRAYTRRRTTGMTCAGCGHTQDLACQACGAPLSARQRVLADFLVGAHALAHADRLLTRDRGYYRTYFPRLRLA